jgi:hypothetical protein
VTASDYGEVVLHQPRSRPGPGESLAAQGGVYTEHTERRVELHLDRPPRRPLADAWPSFRTLLGNVLVLLLVVLCLAGIAVVVVAADAAVAALRGMG